MKFKIALFLFCFAVVFFGCKKKKDSDTPSSVIPNDFLSAKKYDRLVIQIQSVSGYELTTQTTNNLVAFLEQRLNKPGGIEVVKSTVASPGKAILTLEDIRALELKNRTEFNSGKTLAAYFFVVDGEYSKNSGNSKVLGVAYGASSMILFQKSIQDFSGDFNQPSATTLETTVIEHEFCHILGLVNNGTTMQTGHEDGEHEKHCNNTDCLMYFNINSSESMADIFGSGVPALDNNCINDLRANGGK